MQRRDVIKILALLLMLWSPSLMVLGTGHAQDLGERVAILGFSLFVLLCPLLILPRLRHFFYLWAPLTPLIPAWIYLTLMYASVPGDALVAAALTSDWRQWLEVLAGFGWKLSLIPLCFLLYLALARSITHTLRLTPQHRKRLLAGLLLYAMVGMLGRQLLAPYIKPPPLFEQYTATLCFPANLALSVVRTLHHQRELAVVASVHGRRTDSGPMLVVLVIGESVRSTQLGINAYARNTTPGLAALGPALISFPDVASTANYTFGALPNIVSRPLGEGRASVVQTFREAGFRTAWLSNQETSPFSRQADVADHATDSRDFHLRKDMSLLPLFESFLRQGGPQQFIVLHMNGSHVPYEARYTADSRRFSPTLSELGVTEPRPQHRNATLNSYDNTIIELDHFLTRVIALLAADARPAVMMFTSDHGENLFDDQRALFMHSQTIPTRFDTHVPLLAWMNPHWRRLHPSMAEALQANANKKISHVNIFPSLLELGGIEWDNQRQEDSFAAPQFAEKPRKIFTLNREAHDFDSLR